MRIRLVALGIAAATLGLGAQQPEGQLPRFRAGANLVRVDTYVSVNGVALTDLKPEEVEVFEDDRPQQIESLELFTARGELRLGGGLMSRSSFRLPTVGLLLAST